MNSPVDFRDPHWFPVDIDLRQRHYRFLRLDLEQIVRATFLDQPHLPNWDQAQSVPMESVDSEEPQHPPAWILHSAFCCSTLLARALHADTRVVALKEPNILLSLAMSGFRSGRSDGAGLAAEAAQAVRLLARPWQPDGRVLIKPTNVVNAFMPALLAAMPAAPVLWLHQSLEEFLLSCIKKLPAAETRLQWMATLVIPGSGLAERFGLGREQSFNFIESCVLTWFAQMRHYAQALKRGPRQRFASLDMRRLLADPATAVAAVASHLQLQAAEDGVEARSAQVFSRHAKTPGRDYSPQQREQEKAAVRRQAGDLLPRALAWAEMEIAPAMALPDDLAPLRF